MWERKTKRFNLLGITSIQFVAGQTFKRGYVPKLGIYIHSGARLSINY